LAFPSLFIETSKDLIIEPFERDLFALGNFFQLLLGKYDPLVTVRLFDQLDPD